jgi:hypothetical protein
MAGVDGSLAKSLDFGEVSPRNGGNPLGAAESAPRPMLRLTSARRLSGPGKYRVLEARRRHAQIRARRLLDLLDGRETGHEEMDAQEDCR